MCCCIPAIDVFGSRFESHIGFAVLVQIKNNKRGIPDAECDVSAQILPPQKRAVVAVGFDFVCIGTATPIAVARVNALDLARSHVQGDEPTVQMFRRLRRDAAAGDQQYAG